MANRRVCFGLEARRALLFGFNLMAKAMAVTLGPRGRLVIVDHTVSTSKPPEPLKDGATIARRFFGLPDRFESMGALLARHIAWRVEEEVGDGSTTAVLIAQRLLAGATRCIVAGHNPMAIRRGLEQALPLLLQHLANLSQPLENPEQLRALATSITGNPELGGYIEEIFDMVGPHGAIEVRSSYSRTHERQYIQGVLWNQGWVSSYMTTEAEKAILEKPYILLTNYRLQKATTLLPLLEQIHQEGQRGLVVIAHAIEGEALNLLVTNKVRKIMPTLGIRTPGAGFERTDILHDLAAICGGRVFVEDIGDCLEKANLSELGQADEVQAIRSGFTVTGGKGRPATVRQRIQELRRLATTAAPGRERERLLERAGKLLGGVALLYVGGATDVERDYLKERAKEAVRVARLGLAEGIVPGGGVAFLACLPALETLKLPPEEAVVIPLLREALLAPMETIIQNSGYEAQPLIAQAQRQGPGYGFDVEQGEIAPMLESNIIDPVKVLSVALNTAISGAMMALTTETLVHKPRFNRDKEVDLNP